MWYDSRTPYLLIDRPQQSKAVDIVETLDISQSTFLHHLRAAEKKIFSETFEK
ncbi:helix-turn-helix domain-containing protein [Halorubraceae archaeon YAN]|nr:helix-turn-helix domain-containing protein [Halorubraceae archaeon YAN]